MIPIVNSMLSIPLPEPIPPLLATATEAEYSPIVLTGVLLTLVVIYITSKLGGELSKRLDLPPVLGELVGGVVVGVSALHLLMFPENGALATDSVIM
ncbi:MAG: cation:proton antiporter, partial [Symploca sp. SIO2C1]|nr:cation:proton antiporter [Symploca sp. SIO2C1]